MIVTDSIEQAHRARAVVPRGPRAGRPALVIEERLEGREASVIAICDGTRAVALPAARDHKRLGDGDAGPNTGGMGAYSPLPDLDDATVERVLETVHRPILAELARRGTPFRGFLYAGLMLTPDGPALLECNVRLGDPEAQVILPRVAGAIGPLLLAAARGALPAIRPGPAAGAPACSRRHRARRRRLPRRPPARRPDRRHRRRHRLGRARLPRRDRPAGPDGGYGTNGGRVLTIVAMGDGLDDARLAAERAADAISWDGLQRRHDIALDLPMGVPRA